MELEQAFYFQAVLQNGHWERLPINATPGIKHRHTPKSDFVVLGSVLGYYAAEGKCSFNRKQFHMRWLPLLPDGTADVMFGAKEAFIRAMDDRDPILWEAGANVISFETAKLQRTDDPSVYTPTEHELRTFFDLARASAILCFEEGQRLTGIRKVSG